MMSLCCLILIALQFLELIESFQSVCIVRRSGNFLCNGHLKTSDRLFAEKQRIEVNATDRKRPSRSRSSKRRFVSATRDIKNPGEVETWRVYAVEVSPDALEPDQKENMDKNVPPERSYMTRPVLESLLSRLRIKIDDSDTRDIALPPTLIDARVIRRSMDARRRKGSDPKYTYVVDVDVTKGNARGFRFVHQPGRMERMNYNNGAKEQRDIDANETDAIKSLPKVLIVGAGPGE